MSNGRAQGPHKNGLAAGFISGDGPGELSDGWLKSPVIGRATGLHDVGGYIVKKEG